MFGIEIKPLEIIIALIIVAGLISGIFYAGYRSGTSSEKEESAKALILQKTADKTECDRSKQITAGIDNGLQNNLNNINGRLSSGLLIEKPICTGVQLPFGAGSNPSASGTKYAGPNGLSTGWLKQYAATAETYRVKLMACQSLLIEERK